MDLSKTEAFRNNLYANYFQITLAWIFPWTSHHTSCFLFYISTWVFNKNLTLKMCKTKLLVPILPPQIIIPMNSKSILPDIKIWCPPWLSSHLMRYILSIKKFIWIFLPNNLATYYNFYCHPSAQIIMSLSPKWLL